MDMKNIRQVRKLLIEGLREYKESGLKDYITLDIDKKLLHDILFGLGKFAIPDDLWKLIDLSNVSFDGIDVRHVDFTGSKGVKINPQKVMGKNLYKTKLTDVEIENSLFGKANFNGVSVLKTDFTGSKGKEVVINPQKVWNKDLRFAKLENVKINGSLDDVEVACTDFTRSSGAVIDPQKVCWKNLGGTKLANVKIVGSLDDVYVEEADFTGSRGAKMDIEAALKAAEVGANLTDVKIIEPCEYINKIKESENEIVKKFQKKLK